MVYFPELVSRLAVLWQPESNQIFLPEELTEFQERLGGS